MIIAFFLPCIEVAVNFSCGFFSLRETSKMHMKLGMEILFVYQILSIDKIMYIRILSIRAGRS